MRPLVELLVFIGFVGAIRRETPGEFAAVRAEADRWVPVAERLPEETGPHLVWFNYGSNTMSLVTTWFVHGKWALPSYDHRTVTHWKPIKGPEEGK